ncbi:MAG: hypothetical protein IJS28_00250 [Synergistaceae bacterium]|nr:hypothetical protein [Synergistaceae bacterium]
MNELDERDEFDEFAALAEIAELRRQLEEVTRERDELRAKLEEFEHTYGVTEAIEDWFVRGFY